MSRKHIWAAIAAITVAGALLYFYGGSRTPTGQPPLQRVTAQNVAEVKSAFNAAKEDVRLLLLLSPT
jgi:hypothetical protein